jgi:hypothetical protein
MPLYPLSIVSSISSHVWYRTATAGIQGWERFGLYGQTVDSNSSAIPPATAFTSVDANFSDLNWAMDYPQSWYWLTWKMSGSNPYWQTTAAQPSYADITYFYSTNPAMRSVSNEDVNVLSATAPMSDTSAATLVLEYPEGGSASANIVLGDPANGHPFRRPFQGHTTTINSSGTATLQATGITDAAATIQSVPLDITPSDGSIDVSVDEWNTSGDYSKEWTEIGSSHNIEAGHMVGDLKPSTYYMVNVDDSLFGIYQSNGSGQISFTYDGGYSSHTFNVEEDTVPPTLEEVTPVPTLTRSNTPEYIFSSTEAGTIVYGGDCTSSTTSAVSGSSVVTFSALRNGTYSNCTIVVVDAAGNNSNTLSVTPFTVNVSLGGSSQYIQTPDKTSDDVLVGGTTDSVDTAVDADGGPATNPPDDDLIAALEAQIKDLLAQIEAFKQRQYEEAIASHPIVFTMALQYGSRNDQVVLLQDLLKRLGLFPAETVSNGKFGPATLKAVQTFQVEYNIAAPGAPGYGYVGPKTRVILNELID